MRLQRQIVDYALRRRSLLAEVYSGRTGVTEVCDANPYLLRAAKFHGKTSAVVCPICRKEPLTLVSWVYGEQLGAVQHVVSFWRFRFGPNSAPVAVDELIDIFMDFETGLADRNQEVGQSHMAA